MVTIEVPSGLIDAGESPAESALRELKEETGYVGTIPEDQRSDGGWIMWHDPGVIVGLEKKVFLACTWDGHADTCMHAEHQHEDDVRRCRYVGSAEPGSQTGA